MDTDSHLSTSIKAPIPLFTLVDGNSSEWPRDVSRRYWDRSQYSSTQKAIEMRGLRGKIGGNLR